MSDVSDNITPDIQVKAMNRLINQQALNHTMFEAQHSRDVESVVIGGNQISNDLLPIVNTIPENKRVEVY